MLLDRILSLKEFSGFIIIEDTILQSGRLLIKEFVKSITKNDKRNLVILCVESSPQSFLDNITIQQRIVVVDAYSRIGGYDMDDDESSNPNVHFIKSLNNISEIATLVQNLINEGKYHRSESPSPNNA
ncbi:16398_t:CDS:2 [Acaulospora morrowiae]|uniref:16398_t:CDS:1 n=1 Tax=Acaulospora morrowiae TaxID=94023 RepID=A0A9N8YLL3_9GLOM|nr:16398_t:CDS:2 [Acaulospora morrowiae]